MKTCKWWTLKNLVAHDASQGPPSPPEQAVVDAAAATSPTALSENDSGSDGWGDWQPEGTDSLASGASFAHFKGDGKGSLGTTILAKRPRTPFRQPRQECVTKKQRCAGGSREDEEYFEKAHAKADVDDMLKGGYYTPLANLWDGDWKKLQKNSCVLWKGLKKSKTGKYASTNYEWFHGVFHGWDR